MSQMSAGRKALLIMNGGYEVGGADLSPASPPPPALAGLWPQSQHRWSGAEEPKVEWKSAVEGPHRYAEPQPPQPNGRSVELGWSGGGTVRGLGNPFRSNPKKGLPATISAGSVGRQVREAAGSVAPQRVFTVLEGLKNGLRSCIELRQSEVGILRQSLETFSVDSLKEEKLQDLEREIKSSERSLKHLEYQLSRVEQLSENFQLQLKLQQGAGNLAVAYGQRRGLGDREGRRQGLATIRGDIKRLGRDIAAMEAETELIAGSFQIHLQGIVGYARVRAGDVFEVTLRHGAEKWKARGKTMSDKSQAWDRTVATFRADPNSLIHIKAAEVGLLGSTKTLAEQSCDPVQLFAAEPQTLTMDLNLHGTIKLNLSIVWLTPQPGLQSDTVSSRKSAVGSPLLAALRRDKRERSPKANGSAPNGWVGSPSPVGGRRPVSVYYQSGDRGDPARPRPSLNILGPKCSLESGESQASRLSHEERRRRAVSEERRPRNGSLSSSSTSSDLRPPADLRPARPSASGTTVRYNPPASPHASLPRRPPPGPSMAPLALLRRLKPLAQKLREEEGQLEGLVEILILWDSLLKKAVLSSSLLPAEHRRSTANLEAKLGHLGLTGRYNWEAGDEEDSGPTASDGTQDSGFDSISRRFGSTPYLHSPVSQDSAQPSLHAGLSPAQRKFRAIKSSRRKSIGSGLEPADLASAFSYSSSSLPRNSSAGALSGGSTGHAELDSVLVHHLRRVEHLLRRLDEHWGPLRQRERETLRELLGEVTTLETVFHLAKCLPKAPSLGGVLHLLGGGGEAGEVWAGAVVGMPTKLLAPAHLLRSQLLGAYGHIVRAKYPDLVEEAFAKLMGWLHAGGGWEEGTLSLFQFARAFEGQSLGNFVESLGHETWICASLDGGLAGNVEHVMGRLCQVPVLPPLGCVASIAGLMAADDASALRRPVELYLERASGQLRNDVINAMLGLLEAETGRVRSGAAASLGWLRARRSIGALSFVARSDPATSVRTAARRALLVFGDEGAAHAQRDGLGANSLSSSSHKLNGRQTNYQRPHSPSQQIHRL